MPVMLGRLNVISKIVSMSIYMLTKSHMFFSTQQEMNFVNPSAMKVVSKSLTPLSLALGST